MRGIAEEARQLGRGLTRKGEIPEEKRGEIETAVARLRKRVADIIEAAGRAGKARKVLVLRGKRQTAA